MMKRLLMVLLVCGALARPQYSPPAPSSLYQQPPADAPGPPQAASSNLPRTQDAPANGEGMPYEFTWDVDDQETSNTFSHVESSDGETTQGEYRVLLPDGRTQVVKFFDNGGGFNAEVTYEKK